MSLSNGDLNFAIFFLVSIYLQFFSVKASLFFKLLFSNSKSDSLIHQSDHIMIYYSELRMECRICMLQLVFVFQTKTIWFLVFLFKNTCFHVFIVFCCFQLCSLFCIWPVDCYDNLFMTFIL